MRIIEHLRVNRANYLALVFTTVLTLLVVVVTVEIFAPPQTSTASPSTTASVPATTTAEQVYVDVLRRNSDYPPELWPQSDAVLVRQGHWICESLRAWPGLKAHNLPYWRGGAGLSRIPGQTEFQAGAAIATFCPDQKWRARR